MIRVGRCASVFERHFQRHRQTVIKRGGLGGAHAHIGLTRTFCRIAILRLKVWIQRSQMLPVIIELCLIGVIPTGQALGAGDEAVRQRFITMDVHKKVDACIRHCLLG